MVAFLSVAGETVVYTGEALPVLGVVGGGTLGHTGVVVQEFLAL